MQIKKIGRMLFPKGKSEWLLFSGFALLYLSYSIVIVLYTSLVDNENFPVDTYYSFDTGNFLNQKLNTTAHPLIYYLMSPFFFIGDLLKFLFDSYKAKTLFFSVLCCVLISASVVYVFRYLRTIIRLNGWMLYIPVFFYAFTSTNLILCFTPESFPVSAFLLTFTVYYYSYALRNDVPVRLASNVSFTLLLGGITITNFAKGIIPVFFVEKTRRSFVRKLLITGGIFAVFLLLNMLLGDGGTAFVKRYKSFSSFGLSHFFEYLCDFFGASVFFPEIIARMVSYGEDYVMENAIRPILYAYWWQYLFTAFWYVLIGCSAIVNRKNKLVQMLLLLFGTDIFIHEIARFGFSTAFLYGGHWVYCLPLLLGWLFDYASANKLLKTSLIAVTSLLLAGLLVNNLVRLADFIHLALKYWPI